MSEKAGPKTHGSDLHHRRWHPLRRTGQLIGRTLSKAWDDSIFGKAATAAFWQTLSLAPLLLGLLGMIGYIGGWFGPNTVEIIESKIVTFSGTIFSENVVDQIIRPTVTDVLQRGRPEIISVGFLLSLWAGSSAISTFVDSIVEAHGQKDARNAIWQRIFALLLYVMFLGMAVFILPMVALGPTMIGRVAAVVVRRGLQPGRHVLLPGRRPAGHHRPDNAVQSRATEVPAVASTSRGRTGGRCVLHGREHRIALVPGICHGHRLHLRSLGDADRLPAVHILPRLCSGARRRVQRDGARILAGASDAPGTGPRVAGRTAGRRQQRRAGDHSDVAPGNKSDSGVR